MQARPGGDLSQQKALPLQDQDLAVGGGALVPHLLPQLILLRDLTGARLLGVRQLLGWGQGQRLFLLQGAMTYRAGERLIRMTAGDFIYLPREVPHAFRTTGTVPVRFLALALPGGLLDIYDEVGVPAAERRLPDAGVSDADIARWLELAPRYGLRVVGPPIPEAEA